MERAAGNESGNGRERAARAVYAWYSDRRLMVIKDGRQIALDAQDLVALRRFLEQFGCEPGE